MVSGGKSLIQWQFNWEMISALGKGGSGDIFQKIITEGVVSERLYSTFKMSHMGHKQPTDVELLLPSANHKFQ